MNTPGRRSSVPQALANCEIFIWSFCVTDILNAGWTISDQAIANRVGDEMVVLHLANGTYFGLDPIGALLWEALTKGETPSAACDIILDRYEIDRTTVEDDLRKFLDELAQGDLVARV